MYNQLVWDEKHNTGIDSIDKEHQRLFKIINKLFAFGEEEKKSQWACQEGIKYFKEHALKHFAEEEQYMASIHYEEAAVHKEIHTNFRENTLPSLEQELKSTNYAPDAVDHFLGVCAGWLIGHTLTEDLAIVGNKKSKWTNRLPDKERTAVKKTIVQLLYDMFHLESHAISETYSGEKFGRGVYYRLVYSSKEDDKEWEIFLVFEEKLLLNTVGKIMGIKSNKLDTMLLNATRYTAQQFVGRVMKRFPSMDFLELCEMKEENLLTYEQFHNVFERENPQVSLLFDTGAGYFSYCVIAPHLLQNGVGTPIETNNAMAEVEKYLIEREAELEKEEIELEKARIRKKEREKERARVLEIEREKERERAKERERKREKERETEKYLIEKEQEAEIKTNTKAKILIVDDSITIRETMKELLSEDYNVSLAKSGLFAIRAITLDKPDLVLLDYEMPVCDGRQILAMLRSEEEFANVPVIFLTSKTDQESVKKVISLKPEGYLSKYLKPSDIKEKIDRYFERKALKMSN